MVWKWTRLGPESVPGILIHVLLFPGLPSTDSVGPRGVNANTPSWCRRYPWHCSDTCIIVSRRVTYRFTVSTVGPVVWTQTLLSALKVFLALFWYMYCCFQACHLQIHSQYSRSRGVNANTPLSAEGVPGIILVHGHVADALQTTDPDVFVSSDGGYSWSLVSSACRFNAESWGPGIWLVTSAVRSMCSCCCYNSVHVCMS